MDKWTDGVKYRAAYTKVLLILRIISYTKMGTQTEMARKEYLTRGGKRETVKPYQRHMIFYLCWLRHIRLASLWGITWWEGSRLAFYTLCSHSYILSSLRYAIYNIPDNKVVIKKTTLEFKLKMLVPFLKSKRFTMIFLYFSGDNYFCSSMITNLGKYDVISYQLELNAGCSFVSQGYRFIKTVWYCSKKIKKKMFQKYII